MMKTTKRRMMNKVHARKIYPNQTHCYSACPIFTHFLPLNGSRQEMPIESLISSMLIPYRILPDHALNHALFQGS